MSKETLAERARNWIERNDAIATHSCNRKQLDDGIGYLGAGNLQKTQWQHPGQMMQKMKDNSVPDEEKESTRQKY